MKNTKKWLMTYFLCVILIAGMVIAAVVYVDPFMHYHKPLKDVFYYNLNNERSQNDGITKHFDYDALITGWHYINIPDIFQDPFSLYLSYQKNDPYPNI